MLSGFSLAFALTRLFRIVGGGYTKMFLERFGEMRVIIKPDQQRYLRNGINLAGNQPGSFAQPDAADQFAWRKTRYGFYFPVQVGSAHVQFKGQLLHTKLRIIDVLLNNRYCFSKQFLIV